MYVLKCADLQTNHDTPNMIPAQPTIEKDINQMQSEQNLTLRKTLKEYAEDIAKFSAKESELLALNEELSAVNVTLSNELSMYRSRRVGVILDSQCVKKIQKKYICDVETLANTINLERKHRCREQIIMAKHLGERKREIRYLHGEVQHVIQNMDCINKKNFLLTKNLQQEICNLRKFQNMTVGDETTSCDSNIPHTKMTLEQERPTDELHQPKYCQLFKASRNGIERLEISDSENDRNTRIVTLENCVKIVLEPSPGNIINVVTKTGQIQLHSTNDIIIRQWKIALQSVAFSVTSAHSSNLSRSAIIEADNDLYCSSYSEGKFKVNLIPTDASVKCGLEPKLYTLRLTSSDILLKCYDDETITVAKWPYRFVRKYGYRDGKFTFEAGRMCDTGEGTFKLDNANPQEIFRCMATIMKSMKNKISSSAPANQQHDITLSLESGSRNPLSLMPTSTSIECHSSYRERELTSLEDSSIFSTNTISSPCIRNGVPSKPPRNANVKDNQVSLKVPLKTGCLNNCNVSSVFIQSTSNPISQPDSVDVMSVPSLTKDERDYECVQGITDAWRKLGIHDVKHTENIPSLQTELREFARKHSRSARELSFKYRSNIATVNKKMNCSGVDDNYDKLDFFRAIQKSSCEYRTIVPIKLQDTNSNKSVNSSDDYEIVGEPSFASDLNDGGSWLEEIIDDNATLESITIADTSVSKTADDILAYDDLCRDENELNKNLQLE
ncbi:uncharacterized protein LOC131440661 isoform X2 [Malaya genurostris]|uniref:uncharacterized protein LOC131440661 isoform X2 n=1 Tax=Malaya genurostris TaxID=325434 RepID=UPI0026F39849|nr:uncharacterized protein LOC131440661 isoform X2 [Malaya genurostris]